jgi:hypothetical protein
MAENGYGSHSGCVMEVGGRNSNVFFHYILSLLTESERAERGFIHCRNILVLNFLPESIVIDAL